MGAYLIANRRIQADVYPWGASMAAAQADWSTASVGDYSDNWGFPHAGQAGYKGPDNVLVAAEDEEGTYQWTTATGSHSSAGSNTNGVANTNYLVSLDPPGPAAAACRARGASWYLPAKDELLGLYAYKSEMSLQDGAAVYYWSSTNAVTTSAVCIAFASGTNHSGTKTTLYLVRAFRAPDE